LQHITMALLPCHCNSCLLHALCLWKQHKKRENRQKERGIEKEERKGEKRDEREMKGNLLFLEMKVLFLFFLHCPFWYFGCWTKIEGYLKSQVI
jgi:hypothetical protein